MRDIKYIFLHCTAGPQDQKTEDILAFWKKKGWHVPGYHHEINADGTIEDLLPIDQISNGVQGYNQHAIHISYKGGVYPMNSTAAVEMRGRPVDNRTSAQIRSQMMLIEKYTSMFPNAIVLGHRDISPDKNRDGIIEPDEWIKACPAFSVKEWLATWFKSKAPVQLMTTTSANIRSGPGLGFYKIEKALPAEAVVKFLGEADGWTYVAVKGSDITGWVKSEYLKS